MKRRVKLTKVKPLLNSKNNKTQERLMILETMTLELMIIHGVSHLKFKFSGARKRNGSCSSDTIRLSIHHALYSEINEVKNTILHEVAHAIVGFDYGHREVWQNKAQELGLVLNVDRYRKTGIK